MPLFEHDIVREAQTLAGDIVAHLTATAARVDASEVAPAVDPKEEHASEEVGEQIDALWELATEKYDAVDMEAAKSLLHQYIEVINGELRRLSGVAEDDMNFLSEVKKEHPPESGVFLEAQERAELSQKHYDEFESFSVDAERNVAKTLELIDAHEKAQQSLASAEPENSTEPVIEVEPMSEAEEEPKKKPDTAPWPAVKDDEDPTTKPNPVTSLDGLEQNPRTSEEIIQQAVDRILALKYKYAEEEKAILAQGVSGAPQEPLVSIEQIVDPKDTEAAVAATKRKHGLL